MKNIQGGFLNLNESFEEVFGKNNFTNLNESEDKNNIYEINFKNIGATGEWYDGSSIEDGVPYFEGEINILKNKKNFYSDDFDKKEASDIVDDISNKIIDTDYPKSKLLNDLNDKISDLACISDKIILTLDKETGKIISIIGKGKGKWAYITEFIEDEQQD